MLAVCEDFGGEVAWPRAVTAWDLGNTVFIYDRQMVLRQAEALPADRLTAEQKAWHGLNHISSMAQHGL